MSINPPTKSSYSALAQLVSFLVHDLATTQADLAKKWQVNRGTLKKFKTEAKYREIASLTLGELRGSKDKAPHFLRSVIREIYSEDVTNDLVESVDTDATERPRRGIISDETVLHRTSRYPDHDNNESVRATGVAGLSGLSILVRPSNEPIRINKQWTERLSLAVVNIVPEYIESGPQPVFKIVQRGAKGGVIDIEGLILAQDDRIILSGRDLQSRRHVVASIYFNAEEAARYHEPGKNGHRPRLSGVMLGISNARAHFVSPFRMYAIPQTFIAEADKDNQRADGHFKKKYEDARQLAGVYVEEDANKVLAQLGITDVSEDIQKMLDHADEERIFTLS